MKQSSCQQKELAELSTMTQRLSLNVVQLFSNLRFVHHCSGKLRRFLLVHFQKIYVQKQFSTRQGTCHHCGSCCSLARC